MQKTGLIIAGDGDDAQGTVRLPDGTMLIGPADAAEEALRASVGLPCTLCFGSGYIETDGFDGPREITCPECKGEGGSGPREEIPVLSAADLII